MSHLVFVDSSTTGYLGLATAKRLGHKITLVRAQDVSFMKAASVPEEKIAQALSLVDRVVDVTRLNEDVVPALQDLHKADPIHAVMTTAEMAVVPAAEAAKALGLRGPAPKGLRNAVFKDVCRAALARNGLPSALYGTAETAEEAESVAQRIGFPLVIKPTRGVAKEASAVIASPEELRQHLDRLPHLRQALDQGFETFISRRYVLEKYILGDLYSAELLVVDGVVKPLVITRRERADYNPLFEIAAMMPSGLSDEREDEIVDYMQKVFDAVGLDFGIHHVEFILNPEGPVLVEINPRMMGGISPQMYKRLTGTDPFEILIKLHLGEELKVHKSDVREAGLVMALGAVSGGRIPDDVEERLAPMLSRYDTFENTLRLKPGAEVIQFKGNFSILGQIGLVAPDRASAAELGLTFIKDLEEVLDLPIARYPSTSEANELASSRLAVGG